MVSVLIPVYNQEVKALVFELRRQCSGLNVPFEVICLDDGSKEEFKTVNRALTGEANIIYEELTVNLGRSGIRNELVKRAQFPWLWFLDCDADATVNPDLAKNFWAKKGENTLISGGRIYQKEKPSDRSLYLHWLWGSERELLDPGLRMKNLVTSFLSNNFLLHKSILEKVGFDETMTGYGYEDTLFAAELVKAGYKIQHIKNPVMHIGLEPADVFLKKIEESLLNLLRLKEICKLKGLPFPVNSKLYQAYNLLNNSLLRFLLTPYLIKNTGSWRKELLNDSPSLRTFDLYRLAFLLQRKAKA
jgi:glycosyltransferase involved in cell wall biosynthesis